MDVVVVVEDVIIRHVDRQFVEIDLDRPIEIVMVDAVEVVVVVAERVVATAMAVDEVVRPLIEGQDQDRRELQELVVVVVVVVVALVVVAIVVRVAVVQVVVPTRQIKDFKLFCFCFTRSLSCLCLYYF